MNTPTKFEVILHYSVNVAIIKHAVVHAYKRFARHYFSLMQFHYRQNKGLRAINTDSIHVAPDENLATWRHILITLACTYPQLLLTDLVDKTKKLNTQDTNSKLSQAQ